MFSDLGLDGKVDHGTNFKSSKDPARRGYLDSDQYGERHRIDIHPENEPSGKSFFQPYLDRGIEDILATCVTS